MKTLTNTPHEPPYVTAPPARPAPTRLAALMAGAAALAPVAAAQEHAAPADAGGSGDASAALASSASEPQAASCPPPDGTRPDPALIIGDPFVLERFSLERVLGRLLGQARIRRQSATELYQRLWDSLDTQARAKFSGPHCDDTVPPSINGFPVDCPRKEARLKDTAPSTLSPVALVNRFDLHAADGSDCGEYRIVYAMRPFSADNRNFLNLEAVLPNPEPELGLAGCRPVAAFWSGLRAHDPATRRGRRALRSALERFYFEGLTGFEPAISPAHYGLDDGAQCGGPAALGRGQIRTNMFVDATEASDSWQLRQFALARACTARGCHLLFEPAALGDNPFPALFDASQPLPETADFQAAFIDRVESLAGADINRFSLDMPARFNAGQSTSSGVDDHFLVQAARGPANGATELVVALRAELGRLGRADLGPQDIVERAMTQSCAGCHQLSASRALSQNGGAEPIWPALRPASESTTAGFVHVDEHGLLSPALWCTFLPFRAALLEEFLTGATCSKHDSLEGH